MKKLVLGLLFLSVIMVASCSFKVTLFTPFGLYDIAYAVRVNYADDGHEGSIQTLFVVDLDSYYDVFCKGTVNAEYIAWDFANWLKNTLGESWYKCDIEVELYTVDLELLDEEFYRYLKLFLQALKPSVEVKKITEMVKYPVIENVIKDLIEDYGDIPLVKDALKSASKVVEITQWRIGKDMREKLVNDCVHKTDSLVKDLIYSISELVLKSGEHLRDGFQKLHSVLLKCEMYDLMRSSKKLEKSLCCPEKGVIPQSVVNFVLKNDEINLEDLLFILRFYTSKGCGPRGDLVDLLKLVVKRLEELHQSSLNSWNVLRAVSSMKISSVVEHHQPDRSHDECR